MTQLGPFPVPEAGSSRDLGRGLSGACSPVGWAPSLAQASPPSAEKSCDHAAHLGCSSFPSPLTRPSVHSQRGPSR